MSQHCKNVKRYLEKKKKKALTASNHLLAARDGAKH